MKTKSKKMNSMQGFTIIEVVLVLAIAGLIMLMVFLALPAMQRGQRDRQRSQDISRLYTALQNYGNNNKGALPQGLGTVDGNDIDAVTNQKEWTKFYKSYMLAGGDTFEEPAGGNYSLLVTTCSGSSATLAKPNNALDAGDNCTNTANGNLSDGTYADTVTFESQGGTLIVVIGGKCNGETVTAATTKTGGGRKFAIMYKNEGGGVTCQSN